MKAVFALKQLQELGLPFLKTSDAAAVWKVSSNTAQKLLERLANTGLLLKIYHGLWACDTTVDPYRLTSYLSQPHLSYLSLQTALHVHGMIEQVPAIHYAVTLGKTRRIRTAVGVFSFHTIHPTLFGGYETYATDVFMASPEKALFDMAYLSGTRLRRFGALPELELPKTFRKSELKKWLNTMPPSRMRTLTSQRLEALLH